jgi:fumarylacetoacetase
MRTVNATHDPGLRSWVESANSATGDFPIQNLPFGIFRRRGERFRGAVAIGDEILDLGHEALRARASGHPVAEALATCGEPTLNSFMALGPEAWSGVR